MKLRRFVCLIAVLVLTLSVAACTTGKADGVSGDTSQNASDKTSDNTSAEYPITIKHAFGETVIEKKPERIAAIGWGNMDVPLALGVVPVGVSQANYGVTEGEKLLPWTAEKFISLGVNNPVVFDDIDGLDFEAINDVQPDIILAAYSGITQEEYDILSQIAPTVAYPRAAWDIGWREQIIMNATGMGMKAEGEALVADLEKLISQRLEAYPQLKDKTAAFFYVYPADFSTFYIYLMKDPRAAFLIDLGLKVPDSVAKLAEGETSFAIEVSSEKADLLSDIDIIIAYGDETVLNHMQADPLMGTIPAVKRGSVVMLQDNTPLAASVNPSALSIPYTIDEYLKLIAEAAEKVK